MRRISTNIKRCAESEFGTMKATDELPMVSNPFSMNWMRARQTHLKPLSRRWKTGRHRYEHSLSLSRTHTLAVVQKHFRPSVHASLSTSDSQNSARLHSPPLRFPCTRQQIPELSAPRECPAQLRLQRLHIHAQSFSVSRSAAEVASAPRRHQSARHEHGPWRTAWVSFPTRVRPSPLRCLAVAALRRYA